MPLTQTLDFDGKKFFFAGVKSVKNSKGEGPDTYGSRITQKAFEKMTTKFNNSPEKKYAIDFSKAAVLEIFKNPKAKGLRIYYGKRNEINKPTSPYFHTLVLVGYDKNEKDVLVLEATPNKNIPKDGGGGVAVEVGNGGHKQ